MDGEPKHSVNLKSSDDREFTVDLSVAQMSVTIKNMLEGMFVRVPPPSPPSHPPFAALSPHPH